MQMVNALVKKQHKNNFI